MAAVTMMVAGTAGLSVVAAATADASAAVAAAVAAASAAAVADFPRVAAAAVASAALAAAVAVTRATGCASVAVLCWAACAPRLVVARVLRSRAAVVALILRGIRGEPAGAPLSVIVLWFSLRAALLAFLLVDVLSLVHLLFKEVCHAPSSPDSSRNSTLGRVRRAARRRAVGGCNRSRTGRRARGGVAGGGTPLMGAMAAA